MGIGQRYIGRLKCPVCKKFTRHYTTVHKPRFTVTVYCDTCKVTRLMKVQDLEPVIPRIPRV